MFERDLALQPGVSGRTSKQPAMELMVPTKQLESMSVCRAQYLLNFLLACSRGLPCQTNFKGASRARHELGHVPAEHADCAAS